MIPVRRRMLLVLLLPVLLGAGVYVSMLRQQLAFPHAVHERLFPLCESCHAGIQSGATTANYPAASSCASCHDGNLEPRVNWSGPTRRESNLSFVHTVHVARATAAGDTISCLTCHTAGEPQSRMNVGVARAPQCISCHAHAAPIHPASNAVCATCHLPLAASPLSAERVAAFARPAWHDSSNFPATHGDAGLPRSASCAFCHARESCTRCHANADRIEMISALPFDSRVAELVRGKAPEYPAPPSHSAAEWARTHGSDARGNPLSCSNCHTQPSCRGCHLSPGANSGSVIAELPELVPGAAPGVSPEQISRPVHPADIALRHASIAKSGKLSCTECHTTQSCANCHNASESRNFHLPNFVARHATSVFSASSDCQACHSTETFCRACHTRSGVAAQSGMNAAFHTGLANWVLSHGQAARRGIESCASCHQPSDCVRCHSAVGGWRVNPHGPSFPANRTALRNAASCRWCHLGGAGERQ